MYARLTFVTFLIFSSWGRPEPSSITIDQWKARFLLLNHQGAQTKFLHEFDSKEISPLGFLGIFQKGSLVEVCNAFHLAHEQLGHIAITAGHCTTKAPVIESTFILSYYDSRTDRQVYAELQNPKTVTYPTAPNITADFSYFPLGRDISNRWDAIDYKKSSTAQNGSVDFQLWAFQYRQRNDPRFPEDRSRLHPRAVMRHRSAKGSLRKGPQIAAELIDDKGEIGFGLRFGLSLSNRGFDADEKEALFLEKCDWEAGDSGGLITDSENRPIGILVSGENAVTFNNRWNDKLKQEFFDKATKKIGHAPAPKSPLAFWFLGNFAKPVAFQLKEDRKFYAVALLLDAFLAD